MTSIMTKLQKHNTQLFAPDEGADQLENAMPTKRIGIKLADNKPILILYIWLKDQSTKGHWCVYTPHFRGLKAIQDNSIIYWQ